MMDDFVAYFLRPGILVVAVSVYVVVWTIRKTLESIFPVLKKVGGEMSPKPMYISQLGLWWNEVGLHVLPVIIGGLLGLIRSEFLRGPLTQWGDAVMFNCGVGWFSGTLYKSVSKVLSSKLGIPEDPAA